MKDKLDWISKWLQAHRRVDIMDAEFVQAYIDEFEAKHQLTAYGANKCHEIARVLKRGFDNGIFIRSRVGITGGMWGFPKWVFVYELKIAT